MKTKPKNRTKNPKVREVTENKPVESTSRYDEVSQTENLFATETENEGVLPIIKCGLIF